jgi:LmbE family N-acetylglucosaminyl deacetylase
MASAPSNPCVLVVCAHPDDAEIFLGGIISLLASKSADVHVQILANGNVGATTGTPSEIAATRLKEARDGCAAMMGAGEERGVTSSGGCVTLHEPLCGDLEIRYREETLVRSVAQLVREVRPDILLTHAPDDYMEDHVATARIAQAAAFVKGAPLFDCGAACGDGFDTTIYFAQPHSNVTPMREFVRPDLVVPLTAELIAQKRRAVACHESQRSWLAHSQGLDSYVDDAMAMNADLATRLGMEGHVEGLRRRSHIGFAAADTDPLFDLLGEDHVRVVPRGSS